SWPNCSRRNRGLTSGCTRHEPLRCCIVGLYFFASRFARVNAKRLGGTRIIHTFDRCLSIQICAPHPSALFTEQTTALLTSIAGVPVASVGPGHDSTALEQIVDSMEVRRQSLGLDRWAICGMSGG